MATLAALRKQAKGMGIAASVIRGATSASELEEIIESHGNGNGNKGKKASKAAVKKATGKASKTTKGRKASKTTEDDEKPKRGRPKGSKNSTTKAKAGNSKTKGSTSSKSAPAEKSTKGKAKRRATANDDADAGRFLLGDIDFSETDGWNPREDSVPDVIIRLSKKYRGNREKVFDHMEPDLWDYVAKKKQDGTKRSKSEAEDMLRYRISQTIWRFAIQTGQHEASENRVEYGSGDSGGNSKAKSKPKASPKGKASSKTPAKRGKASSKAEDKPKRGRPKGSTTKAKATAGKRGRPKGSKNKK